jgi:molecular chaperone DnaK
VTVADPIYGIDLGTTFTKCALVRSESARPEVFLLDRDRADSPENTLPILRSAVTVGLLPDGRKGAYVGARSLQEIEQWVEGDPELRRFEESKIWIGEEVRGAGDDAPPWPFAPHGWSYRPEDVAALVLRKVKKEVEAVGRGPMTRVVVTHPQNFVETQRQATRQAIAIAGFELVDMLTEPDAAAIAFAAEASPGAYMIFDFGGGTLDVTVADIASNAELRVLGSAGMRKAGRDFDRVVFAMMVDAYTEAYPDFDTAFLDGATKQAWMREAERAKRTLNGASDQGLARVVFGCRNERFPDGQQKSLKIKRERFAHEARHIVTDAIACAGAALDVAKRRWADLQGVLAVGGSSRLLDVKAALDEASGHKLRTDVDADTAIVQGAARYAQGRAAGRVGPRGDGADDGSGAGGAPAIRLFGALARGLGVEALSAREQRSVVVPVLARGRSLPCREKRTFFTTEDGQTSIRVKLYEGEDPDPELDDLVATVELTGFVPGPCGQPVEVSIEVEANGRKHVFVSSGGRTREAIIEFDPRRVLSAAELDKRQAFIQTLAIL